jgi:hypothetical protein
MCSKLVQITLKWKPLIELRNVRNAVERLYLLSGRFDIPALTIFDRLNIDLMSIIVMNI